MGESTAASTITEMKLLVSVTTDTCSKAQHRENAPKTAIGVAQRHYAKVDKIILGVIILHLPDFLIIINLLKKLHFFYVVVLCPSKSWPIITKRV